MMIYVYKYPMHPLSQVSLRSSKVFSLQTEVILKHMSFFGTTVAVQIHLCCLTVSGTPHHMEFHIVPHAPLMEFFVVQMVSNLHSSFIVGSVWVQYSCDSCSRDILNYNILSGLINRHSKVLSPAKLTHGTYHTNTDNFHNWWVGS